MNIVFIDPADLSNNPGFPGELNHPTVVTAFLRVEEAVKRSGRVLGTMLTPGRQVRPLIQRGYDFIMTGADLGILRTGMENQVNLFRKTLVKLGRQGSGDHRKA